MNFGIYLETILKDKNIKKSNFAQSLGISRQSLTTNIEKWKNGREPNVKTIKKYLRVLNLDISDFFNYYVS